MPSTFTWVDFAESDRRKMLDILQLFSDHETRDEMGLGTIRDAFADYFFPGTSTIQTRARYMLFIPWLFKTLEKLDLTSTEYTSQARQLEIYLIDALLKGGETQGVIGQEAKKNLQRLPSNIYWVGLGSWGIRLFQGSQPQYFRYLPNFYRSRKNRVHNDENESIDQIRENWHMGIPKAPKELLSQADFNLTKEEANYLSEMIMYHHRETLLAQLIVSGSSLESRYFWNEPLIEPLESDLKHKIQLARNFSESMHGAVLLYNLMLARKRPKEEWIAGYNGRIQNWIQSMRSRWTELFHWHEQLNEFWVTQPLASVNIPIRTKRFVESWLDIIFSGKDIETALEKSETQSLIQQREFQLKSKRARLINKRALEIWNGASGSQQLEYRWPIASTIINDITKGLSRNSADA